MFTIALATNNTRNNVNIHDVDINTLATAIAIAMRMNDENHIQQRGSGAKDIANAVLSALGATVSETNAPFRASSTMELTDDNITSPPLSPIHQSAPIRQPLTILQRSPIQQTLPNYQTPSTRQPLHIPQTPSIQQQSPILQPIQYPNQNVPTALSFPSRYQSRLFPSASRPVENSKPTTTGALSTNTAPLLEWSLTRKGKDLLIVENHTFKCNKTILKNRYWRCDEDEYCKIWVHTTLDGIYLNMNQSEHEHFCDPDRIVIKKLIGLMREPCKNELISIAKLYK